MTRFFLRYRLKRFILYHEGIVLLSTISAEWHPPEAP